MRLCAAAVAALLVAPALLPAQSRLAAPRPIAITNVTVIDVAAAQLRRDMTVVVTGDRIATIGWASHVRVPAGARVVDGTGRYLIPGLWDMHVHFMNTGESALPLLVAHGVTSVREMGGKIADTRAWQARMQAGTLVGPRIKTAGPILESPQYLTRVRERDQRLDGQLAPLLLPYRIGVATAADAERAVDSVAKLRVDFVKVRNIGSREGYFAVLRAARRAGLTVAGHHTAVTLAEASDSGQKSIEHGFLPPLSRLSRDERRALYARFARNGTWYTPTLVVSRAGFVLTDAAKRAIVDDTAGTIDPRRSYAAPSLLHWWRLQLGERAGDSTVAPNPAVMRGPYESTLADVRGMRDAGVRILVGTDAGSVMVFPGFSVHDELALLVEDARLTPRDALWGATLGPAMYFGMDRELGTIESGRLADLVLLDANPLADIRNTAKIHAVVLRGRLIDAAARRALLEDVARAAH